MSVLGDFAKRLKKSLIDPLDADKQSAGFQFRTPQQRASMDAANQRRQQFVSKVTLPVRSFGSKIYNDIKPFGTAIGTMAQLPLENEFNRQNLQSVTRQFQRVQTPQQNQLALDRGTRLAQQQRARAEQLRQIRNAAPSAALRTGLYAISGAKNLLPSMGIASTLNAVLGDRSIPLGQRIGEGAAEGMKFSGLNRLTAPVIDPVSHAVGTAATRFSPQATQKLAQWAGKAVGQGLGNMAEDELYERYTNNRVPTGDERALSFIFASGITGVTSLKDLKLDDNGYLKNKAGRWFDPINGRWVKNITEPIKKAQKRLFTSVTGNQYDLDNYELKPRADGNGYEARIKTRLNPEGGFVDPSGFNPQPTKGVEAVRAKDVITYTDRLGKTTVGTVDHVGARGLGSEQKVISVVDANGNKVKLSDSELSSIRLVRKGADTTRADKIDNYLLDTKDEFEKLRDSKELSQLNYYEHLRNKYQTKEITKTEFEKRLRDAKITEKSLEKSRAAATRFEELKQIPQPTKGVEALPTKEVLKYVQGRGGKSYGDVMSSIEKSGFDKNQPIVINKFNDGTAIIVDGNGRALAARDLGLKEVPVIIKESGLDPKYFPDRKPFEKIVQQVGSAPTRSEFRELSNKPPLVYTSSDTELPLASANSATAAKNIISPTKGVEAQDFTFTVGKNKQQKVKVVDTPQGKKLQMGDTLPLTKKQLLEVQVGQKTPSQLQSQGQSLRVGESPNTIQFPTGKNQKIKVVESQTPRLQTKTTTVGENKLQQQLVGAKVNTKPLKLSSSNASIPPEVQAEIKAVERAVDKKVGLLDYLRTPDRVLKKIGLEKEATQIKQAYNNYLDELPQQIDKVTAWYNRVKGNNGSEQRIFRYLDGQKQDLSGEELKVAQEIQSYLKEWADRLDLPQDKRIASYITHIFEKDFLEKEFDPDLAKIIADRVPGSVYDPFLQQRLGQKGYVEDVFRALDAYVKRATRKANMDSALYDLQASSNKLDLESWNYVKNYADRINLRPTDIDNLLDTAIKQSPVGYKFGQRPTATISRGVRQMVYRGTLGLNVGSAVRNLTQGVNTYAQLGEKYTTVGYMKALRSLASKDDELARVGVLRNNIIEDRSLSATKKFWENLDKGLFSFFEAAERINRGAAYYGAKSKALAAGLSEKEAIQAGVEMARKTQFTFGSVDTPVALQSDLVKVLTQFQSFNVKQTEFLGEMVKNKEYAGMVRWLAANAVILATVGQAMGWDWKDFVPFGEVIGGDQKLGATPPLQLAGNVLKLATGGKDKFGQSIDAFDVADSVTPFVPAGVQLLGKTIPGIYDVNRGYATSDWGTEKLKNMVTGQSGRVKFPIEQSPGNYVRAGIFGTSKLPEAREYKKEDRSVLGEKQSQLFKQSEDKQGLYNQIIGNRLNKSSQAAAKAQAKESGEAQQLDKSVVYFDSESGQTKTINYGKYTGETPKGAVEKIRYEEDKFKTALKVYRSSLSEQEKDTIFKQINASKEDLEYYDIAADSHEVRKAATYEILAGAKEADVVDTLAELRKEVGGERILTDTVVDDLYNEGVISSAEKKHLKDLKWDSKTKKVGSKSAKRGKAKKIKIGTTPTIPNVPPLKVQSGSPIKFSLKAPTIQRSKLPTKGLRLQGANPNQLVTQSLRVQAKKPTFTPIQVRG